nr:MAG TPA: hypothetical protein [Caudoviricetes sp.]
MGCYQNVNRFKDYRLAFWFIQIRSGYLCILFFSKGETL